LGGTPGKVECIGKPAIRALGHFSVVESDEEVPKDTMSKKISVTSFPPMTERSWEALPLDRKSYRVAISDGDRSIVVEARISLGLLETLPQPEQYIETWFANHPLPESGVVYL
jgi:hypothetical protein